MLEQGEAAMKLLLITSTYPTPHRPHQGVFNGQLVQALEQNHQVRVIAPIPWTERAQEERAVANRSHTSYPIFYYPPRIFRWSFGFWYWMSIRSCLRRVLEDFRPDAVLGYWAHPDGYAALRAARSLGVPCVSMVGGTDIRILAQRGLRRRVIQSVLMRSEAVVAFSRDLANHVIAMGIDPSRVHVLYRGVDRSMFFPGDRLSARSELGLSPSDAILLWVGRFVDVKNPSMAVRLVPALRNRLGGPFQLILIGDGPLLAESKLLAKQLEVEEHCLFMGAKRHGELATWFRAANLSILTSLSEGVPNVLLESIACGTSFVATDVGGVGEIADPDFDVLVNSQDEAEFRHAVVARLHRCDTTTRPESVHDVRALAGQLTQLLERLLKNGRS
jgi:teichuronic acid biosynthesis glycosyltransferase TuaC